jgi:hypothetical protein
VVKQGFIAAGLLLALILGILWHVSASAQQSYNNVAVNGLIATVTASAASSIQFTGANWSTNYNSLYLNCSDLTVSASGNYLLMRVAEATAGWETASTYTSVNIASQSNTAPDILDTAELGFGMTTTSDFYLQFTINNPGSSAVNKVISGIEGGGVSTDGYGTWEEITGWWNADTTALTGIELVPNSGTMSGTCSLYGIP